MQLFISMLSNFLGPEILSTKLNAENFLKYILIPVESC